MTVPVVLLAPVVVGDIGYTWTEPDGTVHNLMTSQFSVLEGLVGWWMPPARLSFDLRPHTHGARFRRVRYAPRELTLPLFMEAANNAALDSLRASVLHWFDPDRGEGVLTRTAVDGTARQLRCRASSGPDMDRNPQDAGEKWQIAQITLTALDPFWENVADTTATFILPAIGATWYPFDPFPNLTASSLFTSATVTNPGQMPAEPVWTITGPGVNPVLRNLTTGSVLDLTRMLVAGESLTVDTRVDRKVIRDQSGNKVMSAASQTAEFWTLAEGSNDVQIEISNATVATLVQLSYRPRFLGPYPGV